MPLKFLGYYYLSFLETNWTFIAYILKITRSSREADVSFIEAHREVRSHRINFPVLLLPQEDVWKMPAPLNWFRNEFITWGGLSNFVAPQFFCTSIFCFVFDCFKLQSFVSFCFSLKPVILTSAAAIPPPPKKHLIHWVLGGFTNIAIKQSQCFYCALDLKIEAGLTAGSRRTFGKGLVFVRLHGDEWPVSTRWLVCTIKLSKSKDFSLIVPFREELWNSELFATAGELAGLGRGEGEGQTEFSALRPAWQQSEGTRRQTRAYFLHDGEINCIRWRIAARTNAIQRDEVGSVRHSIHEDSCV